MLTELLWLLEFRGIMCDLETDHLFDRAFKFCIIAKRLFDVWILSKPLKRNSENGMRQEQRKYLCSFFFWPRKKCNFKWFGYLSELLLALSPSFCDLNPTYKVQPRQPVWTLSAYGLSQEIHFKEPRIVHNGLRLNSRQTIITQLGSRENYV